MKAKKIFVSIISMIFVLSLTVFASACANIGNGNSKDQEIIYLIDASASCLASSDDIAKYVRDSVESDEKNKIGIIAFGKF